MRVPPGPRLSDSSEAWRGVAVAPTSAPPGAAPEPGAPAWWPRPWARRSWERPRHEEERPWPPIRRQPGATRRRRHARPQPPRCSRGAGGRKCEKVSWGGARTRPERCRTGHDATRGRHESHPRPCARPLTRPICAQPRPVAVSDAYPAGPRRRRAEGVARQRRLGQGRRDAGGSDVRRGPDAGGVRAGRRGLKEGGVRYEAIAAARSSTSDPG